MRQWAWQSHKSAHDLREHFEEQLAITVGVDHIRPRVATRGYVIDGTREFYA